VTVRVAIVGSGPAGFYAAGQLLALEGLSVTVDMFDRLATPWGLVRSGVAPDHPKIKSVTRVYEKIAKRPGFAFRGNVELGSDIGHGDLAAAYHAVIYAVGAAADRRLDVPGEDLAGSHAATEFVAWYNGHPDHAERRFDLSCRRAVVVGNGNVALDVARMLALEPAELAATDTADHALAALAASRIEEIVVLGRRGPAQAAYTNPELRELAALADADVIVDPAEIELDPHSESELACDAAARRNVELLREYAQRAPRGARRRIVLRFLASPVRILGDGRVEGVRIVRNELVRSGLGLGARPTGRTEDIAAGLVLRSIGYRGTPLPGLPFDETRGTIANEGGRVTDLPGAYVAGWIKRGPSGVIGTNKRCAQETVDLIVEDLRAGRLSEPVSRREPLLARLGGAVDYAGWEAIDAHERRLGEPQGRPRVKLASREEILAVANPISRGRA
jgi:ferredoxin--NADP+ reductase